MWRVRAPTSQPAQQTTQLQINCLYCVTFVPSILPQTLLCPPWACSSKLSSQVLSFSSPSSLSLPLFPQERSDTLATKLLQKFRTNPHPIKLNVMGKQSGSNLCSWLPGLGCLLPLGGKGHLGVLYLQELFTEKHAHNEWPKMFPTITAG